MKKWIEYRRNKRIVKMATMSYLALIFKNSDRFMEIATYVMSLSKEDLEKIVVNAVSETR